MSLFEAVAQKNVAKVKKCLDEGGDINEHNDVGTSPLFLAALQGDIAISRLFIEETAGADIDIRSADRHGETPLYIASRYGRVEVVRMFIENGALIDKAHTDNGWTPLHAASKEGHVEVVRVLLAIGHEVKEAI